MDSMSAAPGAGVRRAVVRRRRARDAAAAAAVGRPHEAAVHPSDVRCAPWAYAYVWCRAVVGAPSHPLRVPLELVPDHTVPVGHVALPAWLHARVGDTVRLDAVAMSTAVEAAADVTPGATPAGGAAAPLSQPRVLLVAEQPRDNLLSGHPAHVAARCSALRAKLHGLPVAPGCTVAARYGGVLHVFLVRSCIPGGEARPPNDGPRDEETTGPLSQGQRIMLPGTTVLFSRDGERDDDDDGDDDDNNNNNNNNNNNIRRPASRVLPAAAAIAARYPTLSSRLAAVPAFADALREIQLLLGEALRRDRIHARRRLLLPLPRGVLLTGFPGSGKSGLAQHFCELARRDCAAVHVLNGSDLLSESERHAAEGNTHSLLPTLDRILKSARAGGAGRGSGGTVVVLDDLDVLAAAAASNAGGGGGFAGRTGDRGSIATERSARGHALRQVLAFCSAFCEGGGRNSHRPPSRGQAQATPPAGSLLVGITADAALLDAGVRSRLSHTVELPALNTQARAAVSAAVATHPPGSEGEAGGEQQQQLHARIAARTGGFVLRDMVKLHARAHAAAEAEAGGGAARAALEVAWRHFEAALASVRPSRLDTLDARVPAVTFADVGGYADVKRRLNKAVTWQWSRGPAMRRLGVSRASGVLLHGPSGCGKTMLAEALAHECGSNFVAVRLQDVFSPYLGESERFVRHLFRTARRATPCMLFLDDLDAMAAKRDLSGGGGDGGGGGGSGGVGGRILATLLNEMDGVESNAGVVVVAATNRKTAVDPALLRPGRLDVIVEIGMPTETDRASVLAAHVRRMPLAADVDLAAIATDYMTGGLSGAGLKAVCQTAALAAMRETAAPERVEQRHFVGAVTEQRGTAATHGGGFVFHVGK